MRADGSAAQRVRHGPDDEAPAGWSPDGRRILFTVLSTTAHRATVWSMRSNGTDVRRVTRGPYDVAAAWSPDGARVLLTRIVPFANSERGTVVVIRTDGTGAHVLTGGAGDEYATSWQSLR
jgi:Tol biopolymer transport system component